MNTVKLAAHRGFSARFPENTLLAMREAVKLDIDMLEKLGFDLNEVIFLGDQLVTDIACANNLGIDSILVKTIDFKTQKWYTKINRIREKKIIKKINEINPEIANKIKSFKEN